MLCPGPYRLRKPVKWTEDLFYVRHIRLCSNDVVANAVTAKTYEKWVQAYKTKLQLKAVAYVMASSQ